MAIGLACTICLELRATTLCRWCPPPTRHRSSTVSGLCPCTHPRNSEWIVSQNIPRLHQAFTCRLEKPPSRPSKQPRVCMERAVSVVASANSGLSFARYASLIAADLWVEFLVTPLIESVRARASISVLPRSDVVRTTQRAILFNTTFSDQSHTSFLGPNTPQHLTTSSLLSSSVNFLGRQRVPNATKSSPIRSNSE